MIAEWNETCQMQNNKKVIQWALLVYFTAVQTHLKHLLFEKQIS
jgi:hypothetical protein